MSQSRLIITYGTYDLLHYGHIRLLTRARTLGTSLAVGLSSDSFNAIKGKKARMSYEEREFYLRQLRCVDEVFPENTWEQKEQDIKRLNASILVMGDDWKGKFDHFGEFCEVRYLDRTPEISSTLLRGALAAAS